MSSRSHSPTLSTQSTTQPSTRPPSRVSCEFDSWYQELGIHSVEDIPARCSSLIEWSKTKPLFILQLDPVDRAVIRIADERDEIQKKTFTKWVNKHLIKTNRRVIDLYEDLRDGENLVSLLEVLSQEILPRERGRMRVHMLQNVQNALDFLKRRRIKLVNIRPDDIVDSNQKLTLGLIWTIILHYQISDIIQHDESTTFKEALLRWAQKTTEGYPGVKITDFTSSWKDGLAFNAILHRNRPDLLDYRTCLTRNNRENLENAFRIGERDLGITRLLEPEDVDTKNIDEKSMITYISSLYELFPEPPERNPFLDDVLAKLRELQNRSSEVNADIDGLIDWFRDAKKELLKAAPIAANPDSLALMLKETRALNDDINSQKIRVRDVLSDANKLMRGLRSEDVAIIRDKSDELKDLSNHVSQLCIDRLNALEQALPLAKQFFEAHEDLLQWFDEVESEAELLRKPGLNATQIERQQERCKRLLQNVNEHKPLIDRLNKSGHSLVKLCQETESIKIRQIMESDNSIYNALKNLVCDNLNALEEALHATSQFADKLDGMLNALKNTADQLNNAKPIAAHPEPIKEQIFDNRAIMDDLDRRSNALEAVKAAAKDVIFKAGKSDEPAVRDMRKKLDKLNGLWDEVRTTAKNRDRSLEDALKVAKGFWDQLSSVLRTLRKIQDTLNAQETPAVEPNAINQQKKELHEIKRDIDSTKPVVEHCRQTGKDLMQLCGEAHKPEVKKNIGDLDSAWENVTSLYAKREQNLTEAMEKAMNFHDILQSILRFLDSAEDRFSRLGPIASDIEAVKRQIEQLKRFKSDVDAHMVEVEALNRHAQELMERTTPQQARAIREPLNKINRRWDDLLKGIVNRQNELENALVRLDQFHHALDEFMTWISKTEKTLDEMKPVFADSQVIEVEIAKHKVLMNDIYAHQSSVDTLNRTGRLLIESDRGTADASLRKLNTLNSRWQQLQDKAAQRQRELEEILKEVMAFNQEIQDLLNWLSDIDSQFAASKAVGGLPETALEQLNQFMEVYNELDANRYKVEVVLQTGQKYVKRASENNIQHLTHDLKTLKNRWENVCNRANELKIKLETALREATEFHEALQEFLDWFRDAEKELLEAEPISANPDFLALMLKETKALNDDINSQKARVRDVLNDAKKLMRGTRSEDVAIIRDKSDELKDLSNHVSQLCIDRLNALEQALPLAGHFFEAHEDLIQWFDEVESEAELLGTPGLNATQIHRQQERCELLLQNITEHKPLIDRLNKSGLSLVKLCPDAEATKIRQIMESDNSIYNALKNLVRDNLNALEEALHATSQFADKLDGMLNALKNTADQLNNAEPIAAHPERIQEQIFDNRAIMDDLDKRSNALEAVKAAAKDVISKAGKSDEPAIRDMRKKLDKLNDLWDEVQTTAKNRDRSLEDALKVAKGFWDQLGSVLRTLRELQDTLNAQEPPAVEPNAISQQKEALHEIKHDIDSTKPVVEHCRQTGKDLMQLCGEPDKPEVKKNIDDLDFAWENVTSLYAKREQNLAEAMEKAMNFHDILQSILRFLDSAEDRFSRLGPIASDIEAVKGQIEQLKRFKSDVDPHMVEVEALNRHAQELMERTTPQQARAIREPLNKINRRWDDLLKGIVNRQNELENALLRLGQFHHALDEFMTWISKTEKTLDEMKPVFADAQVIEIEIAKHKVLMNDIYAHQTSVDTLNRAGRLLIESDRGSEDASATLRKLNMLNSRWQQLQDKAAQRQRELEEILKEVMAFNQEIQDLLNWLSDIDGQFATSKPVGGLPETAREQLTRFMEVYNEVDANRHKVEAVLQTGQEYVKRASETNIPNLTHNLKTLKTRWESILNRANDRKIKLEIALREATEFHEALQEFVDWLSSAEKYLVNMGPVSMVMENILPQIEEHKNFQKDVSNHRETMLNLDKKGTHLKYFSQKQDVILIKNLLVSVQHRWERVVGKAAERTRALDRGYKEAREFHDAWSGLINWLKTAEEQLDNYQPAGNDPERIKQHLLKHKEFQRALGAKQATYDSTIKLGRALKDKCPKSDVPILTDMIEELKRRWNSACAKSVDRQRKLEESLLFSGQFKDAVQALIDWLDKAKGRLGLDNIHGDLDTVTVLVEQHKAFQEDLKSRYKNMATVKKTASDLLESASPEDAILIKEQLATLDSRWEEVVKMSDAKQRCLEAALRQAEALHKAVHQNLEWLSDAEMKLRNPGPLPDDEDTTRQQITEHEMFMREMSKQEVNKDSTISLAEDILAKCHPDAVSVIRHWITIIQSRWDEISNWAKQRESKLKNHLKSLRDIMSILEELLNWLRKAEADLLAAESEPLPDEIEALEGLIEEHQKFIDEMSAKQPEVERVTKAFSSKSRSTKSSEIKGRRSTSKSRDTPVNGHGRGIEPEIKNPMARELVEKWRNVWLLAMERMRRLQDKLDYIREVERVKNFDFDEWRRRFLGWMNNKKARVMDFFRKIDKDNDGKVTQEDFIEGFLASKFPTSRLEMERVAPIFDRNSDGFIDHKEYLETLRPDRDLPKTEAEIIQDEVQRLVSKCTCTHRYKVFQVGEGKYRFGDSQKLRLVRILRSTVMVRVGGGWVSLDEFLIKNDPCRAKGRTNVELREQFILADGVSQGMAAFKSKPVINPKTGAISTVGPITKIREKTERSVPMSRSYRFGGSTSDCSFSDTDSGSKSRPGSRLALKK